jgi:hypothetical protein
MITIPCFVLLSFRSLVEHVERRELTHQQPSESPAVGGFLCDNSFDPWSAQTTGKAVAESEARNVALVGRNSCKVHRNSRKKAFEAAPKNPIAAMLVLL